MARFNNAVARSSCASRLVSDSVTIVDDSCGVLWIDSVLSTGNVDIFSTIADVGKSSTIGEVSTTCAVSNVGDFSMTGAVSTVGDFSSTSDATESSLSFGLREIGIRVVSDFVLLRLGLDFLGEGLLDLITISPSFKLRTRYDN